MGVTTSRTTARRSRARLGLLGTAAALTAALLSGCGGTATPDDPSTPSAEASAPRPTPSTEGGAQPVGIVIPADCEQMYLPQMFEGLQSDYPPLNDPTMTDPNFSNTDELEELLRSTNFLQCTWGGASGTGIVTAVAKVTAEQSAEAIAILENGDFDCTEQQEGTRCVTREETEGNLLGETHFLRDDVWLSTFWLNAPVRGYTENMIEALWG
ncbi:hypothetical protein IWX78_001932 [Mycetocola sp. CAN_C7]|uniref:hypothetical protein n=1 Tax=Mycetocola sp. CAN_C7 TaxID=2787724 RepID=UPI0018CBEA6E